MKKTKEKTKGKKGPVSDFPMSIYVYPGDDNEGNPVLFAAPDPAFFVRASDHESVVGNMCLIPDMCARYTLKGVFKVTQEVVLKEIK